MICAFSQREKITVNGENTVRCRNTIQLVHSDCLIHLHITADYYIKLGATHFCIVRLADLLCLLSFVFHMRQTVNVMNVPLNLCVFLNIFYMFTGLASHWCFQKHLKNVSY